MNLIPGNPADAARRDVLGIPVCGLGFDDALAFAAQMAGLPFGQTVITFLDAGKAGRMMDDAHSRTALARQVVFPRGQAIDLAARLLHGHGFPADLDGAGFVPALLTYIDTPMRVVLLGARKERLRQTCEALARHAPWHGFIPVCAGVLDRAGSDAAMREVQAAGADILLVAMASPLQEAWIDRHVGPGHARLVIGAGSLLDDFSGVEPFAPVRARRLEGLSGLMREPRFLWHVLRRKLERGRS